MSAPRTRSAGTRNAKVDNSFVTELTAEHRKHRLASRGPHGCKAKDQDNTDFAGNAQHLHSIRSGITQFKPNWGAASAGAKNGDSWLRTRNSPHQGAPCCIYTNTHRTHGSRGGRGSPSWIHHPPAPTRCAHGLSRLFDLPLTVDGPNRRAPQPREERRLRSPEAPRVAPLVKASKR